MAEPKKLVSAREKSTHGIVSARPSGGSGALGISKNLDGRAEAGLPGRGRPSRLVKSSSDSQQSQLDRPADPEFQDQVPKGSLERGTVNSMEASDGDIRVETEAQLSCGAEMPEEEPPSGSRQLLLMVRPSVKAPPLFPVGALI